MSHVVFFDFDSTVVTKESLDEVLAYALSDNPNKEQLVRDIEVITNRGMNGEIRQTDSIELRLKLVPITRDHVGYVGTWLTQHITDGMPELFAWLHKNNVDVYIISSGFFDTTIPTAKLLGVPEDHVFTNHFVYDTQGNVLGPDKNQIIWSTEAKTPAVRHILSQYKQPYTAALIGDGSTDLAIYTHGVVEHFCGFGAHAVRPKVQAESPAFVYSAADAHAWLAKVLGL